MTPVRIIPIVEGHGESEAVPVLIRRIALNVDPGLVPEILRPLRVPSARLKRADELSRSIALAVSKLKGRGGILILIDCDDDCPATAGPSLLAQARSIRPDVPMAVVLAKREYEAWFLAAAESIRGHRGLPDHLSAPDAPEEIRGAKEWLSRQMPPGESYSPTTDQAALTAVFDMEAARRADSFDKCNREIYRMVSDLSSGSAA